MTQPLATSNSIPLQKTIFQKIQRAFEIGPAETAKKLQKKIRLRSHELNYRYSLRKRAVLLLHPFETYRRRKEANQVRDVEKLEPWKQTLHALTQDGFSTLRPDQVDQNLYLELDQFVEQKKMQREALLQKLNASNPETGITGVSASRPQSKKDFFDRLYSESDLRDDHILVRYAMQPSLLKTAARYLGQMPRLSYVEVILSHATEKPGKWKISQRWHRDYDDSRMVKFFTYFTDCLDEEHGPFTYIPAGPSGQCALPVFPVHKTDEALEEVGLAPFEKRVFGKKGSAFMVDTHRCFHRGSRMHGKATRIAYIASFTSHATHVHYPKRIKVLKPASATNPLGFRWVLR